MTRFERDTQVRPVSDGLFEADIEPTWWIVRGPNGGYIGGLLVRALEAGVGDPARTLRSITIHYLRPPAEGTVQIETRVERSGRTLSTVTARMMQGGKVQAMAIAAIGLGREAPELRHWTMPEAAPPEQCPVRDTVAVPIHQHYEYRVAFGPTEFTDAKQREARTGGWLSFREGGSVDAALLVAFADGWPPAVFATSDLPPLMAGVPTVDLTVHIRTPLPAGVPADEPLLVVFETRQVSDGFLEEDGEIWSRDGQLLAHSRQLGVAL